MKRAILVTRRAFGRAPGPLRGMGLMLLAAFCASAMIATVRHLSDHLHPFELAFFRMFFGFLVLTPVLMRHGAEPLRTQRLGLHAVRGALHLTAMLLFFFGLVLTPLAKVTALGFSAPLYATVLAFLVLGEVIRLRRVSALLLGFAGTMVVLRPGVGVLDVGSLFILASAAAWGTALIVIKTLSRTEASLTITLYSALFVTPFTFLAAIPGWQTPESTDYAWFVVMGVLGTVSHLCLAQALKEADVTAVLPFDFTKLIWAALFGFVFFAEVPDWGTWLGGAMIFAAVTYIAYRERRLRGKDAVPSVPAPGDGTI